MKFGTSDYVGDVTRHVKIQNNRPNGGVTRQMREMSCSLGF